MPDTPRPGRLAGKRALVTGAGIEVPRKLGHPPESERALRSPRTSGPAGGNRS